MLSDHDFFFHLVLYKLMLTATRFVRYQCTIVCVYEAVHVNDIMTVQIVWSRCKVDSDFASLDVSLSKTHANIQFILQQ